MKDRLIGSQGSVVGNTLQKFKGDVGAGLTSRLFNDDMKLNHNFKPCAAPSSMLPASGLA